MSIYGSDTNFGAGFEDSFSEKSIRHGNIPFQLWKLENGYAKKLAHPNLLTLTH